MTTFDDRETAFENKFAHDEEVRFKITARRNKLFGLWAANELGKTGAAAEAYATEVVAVDFDDRDVNVVEKVALDLATSGHAIPTSTLRAQLAKLEDKARKEIMSEA